MRPIGRLLDVSDGKIRFNRRALSDVPARILVAAVSRLDGVRADVVRLVGDPRSPIDPKPNACRFYGRCPVGVDRYETETPGLRGAGEGREVACHLAG